METLLVKDRNCPFCGHKLKMKYTKCPNNISLPCLLCESCKIYLYSETYYNVLNQLAKNVNSNLNKKVYKYKYFVEELEDNKIKPSKKKSKSKTKKSKNIKNTKKKNNIPFDVFFYKVNEKLILKIRVPLHYQKLHFEKTKNCIFNFESNLKDKKISLCLLFNNEKAKKEFLSKGLNDIYIYSGVLNILLEDIPEISKNETPFNKMKKMIYIERNINHRFGKLNLKIHISKELVALYIIPLYKNITEPKNEFKSKTIIKRVVNKEKVEEQIQQQSIKKSTSYSINHLRKDVGITAIVIHNSRECIYSEHLINDIVAILRIAPPSSDIKNYSVQAAYCNKCDKYYILKKDFKLAQKLGAILCPVIDLTKAINKKQYESQTFTTESRIHQLGYNVIKKNGYTTKQRQLILANILENTNISKFEIKSNIERCIKQHQNQPNYVEAVNCWRIDYEFVSNYKIGDLPQVKVEKIIIK